jgi:hypothetical protein
MILCNTLLCLLLAQIPSTAERERLGVEMCFGTGFLQDFKPSYGGSVDIIFITDDRLGASLGIHLLRNRGESIYKEVEPGLELVSATSAKYLTISGFELNYVLIQKRVAPYAGIGLHWLYFHEQSQFVYYAPGWRITTWKNFQGDGFCVSATLGSRYIINPSVAVVTKIDLLLGRFYYPPLGKDTHIKGIAISLGMRL